MQKIRSLQRLLEDHGVHFAAITESHITTPLADQASVETKLTQCTTNSPSQNSCGVTLWSLSSRVTWDDKDIYYNDNVGRALGVALTIDKDPSKKTLVLVIYAPNTEAEKMAFWQNFPQEVLNRSDMVLGDFNMVTEILDRNPPKADPPQVVRIVTQKLHDARLMDGWRTTHPEAKGYTYTQANEWLSTGRIDRIYCKSKIHRKACNWKIQPVPTLLSDHSLVSVEYNPKLVVKPGKSTWRMNCSYLSDPIYTANMVRIIQQAEQVITADWVEALIEEPSLTPERKEYEEDTGTKDRTAEDRNKVMILKSSCTPENTVRSWSALIREVAAYAKTFQAGKARNKRRTTRKLQKRLERAKARTRDKANGKNVRLLAKAQTSWDSYQEAKMAHAKHNAKARWIDDGEGTTKQFFAMANIRHEELSIYGLKDQASSQPDRVRKKQRRMEKVATAYYTSLFENEETNERNQELLLATLNYNTSFEQPNLVTPVSSYELRQASRKWSTNSAPGPNGIPYEWFKHFLEIPDTAKELERAILCLTTTMIIHQTPGREYQPDNWLDGTISLLYKKGDRAELKNYRPISLINTDYKIVSAVINNRLLEPTAKTIGSHQTGFLPGRHIMDTIKEAQILLDRADKIKEPLYMILLDQEKAYDRVDQAMLHKILAKIGVPDQLRTAIYHCSRGATSRVSINKHLTRPILLQRGVRQGDPLSCLLFNLVIETLARLIIGSDRLPGVKDSRGNAHKIGLFADDFRVNLTNPNQWKAFERCYKIYSSGTQAKRNIDKTIILYAGTENPPETIGGIPVTPKGVPKVYLGIPIGNNVDPTETYTSVLKKIVDKIQRWKYIYMSLRGRVKIAKMIMYSKMWYYLRIIPITTAQLHEIEETVERYIWVKEPNQPLRRSLRNTQAIKSVKEGGIGALDISTMRAALNIYWIARLKKYQWESPQEDTPGWIPLAMELILETGTPNRGVTEAQKKLLRYPWVQRWQRSEQRMPASIQYWWQPWTENNRKAGHRHHLRQPRTAEEVQHIYFWFHPQIWQGERSVKWGSCVWVDLGEGRYGPVPQTLKELVGYSTKDAYESACREQGTARAATLQRAIKHLLELLPDKWKEIWDWEQDRNRLPGHTGPLFDQAVVHAKNGMTLPLGATNKQLYKLLVSNVEDPESLHMRLTRLGSYSYLDSQMVNKEPERIWEMLEQKKLYYPKVTDLLWRIFHDICNAGKSWAEPRDCPICNQRQVPEHLFWTCPAAQAVWALHQRIWYRCTLEPYPALESYTAMMLDGASTTESQNSHRRRRILYSEALWAIWLLQTEWSREGACDFTIAAAVERFKHRVVLRIKADRLLALGFGTARITSETYQKVWGLTVDTSVEAHILETEN